MKSIALTPGNVDGIGPELFPLALHRADIDVDLRFIWCGTPELFLEHAHGWKLPIESIAHEIRLAGRNGTLHVMCTNSSPERALLDAIELARREQISAIVTGPMRKASVIDDKGNSYGGQTELLHHYLGDGNGPPLMCFGGYSFWLALATIHVPIRRVADEITTSLLVSHLRRLATFGKHIAVLGLNPHAGENGLIGDEEIRVIQPAIAMAREFGLTVDGPLAADGFFGNLYRQDKLPNAVLAMTHDQGLGPYKILTQGGAINTTLGLTVVRTSPAHGTADELVGRYTADPQSMINAIEAVAHFG